MSLFLIVCLSNSSLPLISEDSQSVSSTLIIQYTQSYLNTAYNCYSDQIIRSDLAWLGLARVSPHSYHRESHKLPALRPPLRSPQPPLALATSNHHHRRRHRGKEAPEPRAEGRGPEQPD